MDVKIQLKSLVERVSDDVLTEFAKTVVAAEATFAHTRKPEARGAEYRPEHFEGTGRLTDAGLSHTRGLITEYQAIGNMFLSYVQGRDEIKERLGL